MDTTPKPKTSGLHLDMSDDNETPEPRQEPWAIFAFCISFFPILGLLGLIIALHGVWRSHHARRRTSGLYYGVITMQLLYTILILVGVSLLMTLPRLSLPTSSTPDAKTGEQFISNLAANPTVAKDYIDPSALDSPGLVTTLYQDYGTKHPQLVYGEVVEKAHYQDAKLSQSHADQPVSLQVWKVGDSAEGVRYLELVLAETTDRTWRVVRLSGGTSTGAPQAIGAQLKDQTLVAD